MFQGAKQGNQPQNIKTFYIVEEKKSFLSNELAFFTEDLQN